MVILWRMTFSGEDVLHSANFSPRSWRMSGGALEQVRQFRLRRVRPVVVRYTRCCSDWPFVPAWMMLLGALLPFSASGLGCTVSSAVTRQSHSGVTRILFPTPKQSRASASFGHAIIHPVRRFSGRSKNWSSIMQQYVMLFSCH